MLTMHYEKTYRPTFTVVGIACRASNAQPQAIYDLWQRFYEEKVSTHVLARVRDAVYAIYCEYDSDHTGEYTFVLGYEVPADAAIVEDPPDGLVVAVIPAAQYAVIEARGEQPEALISAWEHVGTSTLARSYICDFEVHWGPMAVEVYVGMK